MTYDIIIVGGGASGILHSIILKRNKKNLNVLIIEKNNKLGKKLLATGNGRCNFTNIYLDPEVNYRGTNSKFVYSALGKFSIYDTLDLFESIGITPRIENDGRVFPMSLQSSSVVENFKMELKRLGIDVLLGEEVIEISKDSKFKVYTKNNIFQSKYVVVSTGGLAMPSSGCDERGYEIAKKLGHTLIEPLPGLVQLKLKDSYKIFEKVDGVKYPGKVSLYIDNKFIDSDSGDILFRTYGISGPPILQLSNQAIRGLNLKKKVELEIKLLNDITQDKLEKYLSERIKLNTRKTVEELLIGLVNDKLIKPILYTLGIDKDLKVLSLGKKDINKLANILISWKFEVIGNKGWKYAQVTSGGINTDEIDNMSMESKIVKNLYFTGEILDIDGDCGGYNLQWAWSSAYLAAENILLKER